MLSSRPLPVAVRPVADPLRHDGTVTDSHSTEPPAGPETRALLEEAAKKSAVLWLTLPGLPQPRAAWHIWHEGAAYVLTGGEGEQPLPGLPETDRVTVILRGKDKGGRLIAWVAAVESVEPESEDWAAVVPLLAKERLNAVDGEEQPARWATGSYILRLTPTGEVPETPAAPRADYATVRPVPTPATTSGRNPFMLGARRRKADR